MIYSASTLIHLKLENLFDYATYTKLCSDSSTTGEPEWTFYQTAGMIMGGERLTGDRYSGYAAVLQMMRNTHEISVTKYVPENQAPCNTCGGGKIL